MTTLGFPGKYQYSDLGEVFFNDGRELELLNRIFALPEEELSKLRNNPTAILEFIDQYGTEKFMMNVGEVKGKHVVDLITAIKPKTCVELGGYVGYSTLLFGSTVRDVSGSDARYYCIEINPIFGSIIMALVDLAGLSSTIKVIIGQSKATVQRLQTEGALSNIDFLFLDHMKSMYTSDLKSFERLGLIRPGIAIAADNMIQPGNPQYLEYINMTAHQKIEAANGKPEEEIGNPKLVYESKFIESWGPHGAQDAVEISHCVDELK